MARPFRGDINMSYKKDELLNQFRGFASQKLEELPPRMGHKDKASAINQAVSGFGEELIAKAKSEIVSANEKLNHILMISYVRDIVMLESRNKVWPYEYMAFSRRVGEIWEPFCKLPFYYPMFNLSVVQPLSFNDVKKQMIDSFDEKINQSGLSVDLKEELKRQYMSVWTILDSGNISLDLDLHFMKDGVYYDVDYKSGFSSNEKGNTNRLLQVGSIYSLIDPPHKNLIFVRQPEEDNNHYLQTLKNSPYWEVFCANAAYAQIKEFTGFDLREWMTNNMRWEEDICNDFKTFLIENHLLRYLLW